MDIETVLNNARLRAELDAAHIENDRLNDVHVALNLELEAARKDVAVWKGVADGKSAIIAGLEKRPDAMVPMRLMQRSLTGSPRESDDPPRPSSLDSSRRHRCGGSRGVDVWRGAVKKQARGFNLAEYLDAALESFRRDPPDSPFQRGYREALREVARVAGLDHLLVGDDTTDAEPSP